MLRFLPLYLGEEGWGPGLPAQVSVPSVTSGHPWPPLRFRSLWRSQCPRGRAPDALHILRCAAPVCPHLPAHRCRADSPGYFGDFQHPGPPTRPLHLLFGKRRRERRRERPGLRGSPLSTTSPPGVTCSLCCETLAPPEGRFVFTLGDQKFAVTLPKTFFLFSRFITPTQVFLWGCPSKFVCFIAEALARAPSLF